MQPKAGGKLHLRLNTDTSPIAHKYREGKLKRTLKREFNSTWNRLEANGEDRNVRASDSARRPFGGGGVGTSHDGCAAAVPFGGGRTSGVWSATTGLLAVRSVWGRWPSPRRRCYRPRLRWPVGRPRKTLAAGSGPCLCRVDRPGGTVASAPWPRRCSGRVSRRRARRLWRIGRSPVRPVLKHGPRSLTCARVVGHVRNPEAQWKQRPSSRSAQVGSPRRWRIGAHYRPVSTAASVRRR